jgi:hypothetical protein
MKENTPATPRPEFFLLPGIRKQPNEGPIPNKRPEKRLFWAIFL